MTRPPFASGLLLAAVLLLPACKPNSGAAQAAAPVVPVQMAVAVRQDVPRSIESVGAVQALRSVIVKSQVDGIIAQVHFKEGQEVAVGDLLVTLDRRPFENALLQARAALATAQAQAHQAQADLERYSRLDQQAAVSKEEYALYVTKADTTQADVQAATAAVANAELQLGYTEIRAPIAGRTGQILLHEGALVKANDNTFSLVSINQLTPISVAYTVPEDSLPEISAALAAHEVKVRLLDRVVGATRLDGQLDFIDNTVDATTGTIVLKANFANADHALWPGQFVHIRTQTGVDRGAVVVPASAVQTGQNQVQVYVVKADHTVELRPVTILRTANDIALVRAGVQAGETVVTDGQLRLVPGAKVEAKPLVGMAPAPATASY